MRFPIIYERNESGWWAYAPDVPGFSSHGRTREELERELPRALRAHFDLMQAQGEPLPMPGDAEVGFVDIGGVA